MSHSRDVAAVVLALALWGCSPTVAQAVTPPADRASVTLQVPGDARADDGLQVLVTLGPTPPRSRLLLRLASGGLVGVVAPFGPDARAQGGTYAVPLDPSASQGGAVTLHLELEEENGRRVRPPTSAEVRRLTVVRTQ